MTIFPFQISEGVHVYNRMSKLNTTTLLESEHEDPRDIISISAEAKKKQILEQTKGDVLERIRETTKDGEKRL